MLIESSGERRCLRCEVKWVGKHGNLHRNAGLEFLEITDSRPQFNDTPFT